MGPSSNHLRLVEPDHRLGVGIVERAPARDPQWRVGAPQGHPRGVRRGPPIQRCQVHKLRNILDHLPERQRPWVQAGVRRAYQATDSKVATRLLTDLAKRLDHEYPSAAGSVREGLEETLTVVALQPSSRLQRFPATTNAAKSLLSHTRHVKRNVKCWRGGQMMLRRVAAGVLEAVKGFRRLKGHANMPRLLAALPAHDQCLGLGVAAEHVA